MAEFYDIISGADSVKGDNLSFYLPKLASETSALSIILVFSW